MSTVLVVDYEFGIVELIVEVLTDEGRRVVTASHGRQGLEVLASNLAFVLDYMMPVLEGAATLRSIAEDAFLTAFRS